MHWDHMHRQVRIEGLVQAAPAADSDAYFASRARESRIGAWASAQSQPVASREALLAQVNEATERFATGAVARPSFWGGYRLWAEVVELWVAGQARIHDRARWTRSLHWRPTVPRTPARGPSPVCSLEPHVGLAARHGPDYQRRRPPPGAGLTVNFAPGEFVAVLGRNGCGKSLTLHTLAGLRAPHPARLTRGPALGEAVPPPHRPAPGPAHPGSGGRLRQHRDGIAADRPASTPGAA